MAENTQTFILVGDFKDNITPSLKKLNTQVEALTKNFAKISKKLRPISKEFGNMAEASERMARALKSQRGAFDSQTKTMAQYRKEASKTRAANEQLARSSEKLAAANRRAASAAGGSRGGGGGGGRGGLGAAEVGGAVAGVGLANFITSSIVKGFNIGVGIMRKPFQYGANAIAERINDEMSDIKSAGGMFSVDRRENLGIFKTFDDAMRYQEELNARLARSAAALPGETAEYVAQAKQITDTIMLSYAKNREGFDKFAKELDPKNQGGLDAMGLVLQKFTEKSVLLGQGEGNTMYGVPQILEMLVSQEKINLGAFRKFGAYMRNPLLKNALESAEKELKATGANTAERFRVIQKVLDQAVPNEVVMKMQNSADGIIQAVRSAFLDPETGLLGLGRKLDIAVPRVDAFGRYLDKYNNVVATVEQAHKETGSLFQVLKETLAGLILPMTAVLDLLPQIYDPLAGLAEGFLDLRNISQQFYRNFNAYTKYFEKQAQAMGNQAEAMRQAGDLKGADAMAKRAGKVAANAKIGGFLSATNDLLLAFGAINTTEYQQNAKTLVNDIENLDSVGMFKKMFSQLLSSDFMRELGDAIGALVGGVLKAVGDLMAGANSLAEAGPFAEGLKKGFDKAKGGQGIALIFKNLFSLIGKGLMTLFKSAPVEMSILSALTVGMPLLQGAITAGMTKLFGVIATKVGTMGLGGGLAGMGASISGWLGAVGPALAIIGKVLPPIALTLAAVVALGGGFENTMRQLKEIFGELLSSIGGGLQAFGDVISLVTQFTVDLVQGIIELIAAVFNLIPGVDIATQNFDLLKVILIPITATFQLFEMGLRGLAEGLSNVRLWLLEMTNWGGRNDEKIKQAKEDLRLNTEKGNESKRRIDVYNTAIRYGGPGNYAKVLEKDIAAKEREMKKEGLLKAEREKLNNELFMLRKTLAEANRQAGPAKPTGDGKGTPNLTTPNVPGVTSPAPAAPAAAAAPAAVAQATAQATAKAVEPVTTAVQAGTTATQGVTTAVNSASTNQITVTKEQGVALQKTLATMIAGLNNVKSALIAISSKVSTQPTLAQVQAQGVETNNLLRQVITAVKSSGMNMFGPGGFSPPLGGAQGNLGSAAKMASANGLTLTSSFRPGDKGYHGVGRAMDFSNSTGPTPQMMQFAQQMIAQYGSSLTELIYSPLGYSIKNGRKVAPLAYGSHFNHVHVAFGRGPGNPTLFSSAGAAQAYERMMAPAGARVATVTANSSEFGGGSTTVNQNITINGADDPRRLAEMVFNYAAQAAQHVNNSSFA